MTAFWSPKVVRLRLPELDNIANEIRSGHNKVMDVRVKISELKAHFSAYLARVRSGESVTVCDRHTPVARLVPADAGDGDKLVVKEAVSPTARLKSLKRVPLKGAVDPVELLREDRDRR